MLHLPCQQISPVWKFFPCHAFKYLELIRNYKSKSSCQVGSRFQKRLQNPSNQNYWLSIFFQQTHSNIGVKQMTYLENSFTATKIGHILDGIWWATAAYISIMSRNSKRFFIFRRGGHIFSTLLYSCSFQRYRLLLPVK